jgi:hypothetical protein
MEDYNAWVPSQYLTQYYATGTITEDEQGILQFIVSFLKEKKIRFSEMLEIGCGPTIHHAMPFVPYVDRIYMADYLESNLAEIQKVIDQANDAHDWDPYIAGVLDLENAAELTEERTQTFRKKVEKLLPCNVLSSRPLGRVEKTFPLVTSFYCLECVSGSKLQWTMAMSNVSGLVAAGGWLILSALRNAASFLVCGKEFPATSIDEEDLRLSLLANGFVPDSIEIQVCNSTWGAEGFDTIMVCSSQKQIKS